MELFEKYPYLENETVALHRMTMADADALRQFTACEEIYRYLPTFLFEKKYEDPEEVIARMDEECFRTKESILLGIYPASEPEHLVGIAEIYGYEANKEKASLGCRLHPAWWGNGIAVAVAVLLKDYLLKEIGLRTVTLHIMADNTGSGRAAEKAGFLKKYPGILGDWGKGEFERMDKYVVKRNWLGLEDPHLMLPDVEVEQFVMAYGADQDRLRAMMPEGYRSLRPVLRINAEIRDEDVCYVEFNTPVEAYGKRGWLNIGNWKSTNDDIRYSRSGSTVTITAPFLELTWTPSGIEGGCPAERDNDGCFFIREDTEFRPAEIVTENKEFCDCAFRWRFHEEDACGQSEGRTIPAAEDPVEKVYEKCALTPENAAAIPCRQVLGAYIVRFRRIRNCR